MLYLLNGRQQFSAKTFVFVTSANTVVMFVLSSQTRRHYESSRYFRTVVIIVISDVRLSSLTQNVASYNTYPTIRFSSCSEHAQCVSLIKKQFSKNTYLNGPCVYTQIEYSGSAVLVVYIYNRTGRFEFTWIVFQSVNGWNNNYEYVWLLNIHFNCVMMCSCKIVPELINCLHSKVEHTNAKLIGCIHNPLNIV